MDDSSIAFKAALLVQPDSFGSKLTVTSRPVTSEGETSCCELACGSFFVFLPHIFRTFLAFVLFGHTKKRTDTARA